MNKKYRQILESLTISHYRKLYRLTSKPSIKIKLKKKLWVFLGAITLCMTACNDAKPKPEPTLNTTEASTSVTEEKKTNDQVILFYGNSLTAGYGLDPSESFPSLIENKIDSLDLPYKVVNAGLSGETTSGGLKRIDWVMNQQVDIFVLELGANDMLRGLPLEETRKNLKAIIEKVRQKNPEIKIGLCEMMAAPNMGKSYVDDFSQIYKELSQPEDVVFFPFFLDGVAGIPDLLLPDGKHPNAKGQKIVAENIWTTLKTML